MSVARPEPSDHFEDRLRNDWGLTWAEMRDGVLLRAQAIARGYEGDLDAVGASGTIRFLHLVRCYRSLVIPKGFYVNHANNISRTVDPSGRRALVVTAGDAATGKLRKDVGRDPKTRHPKGEAMRTAVESSQLSLNLPPQYLRESKRSADAKEFHGETWLLLTHATKRFLWSEISHPKGFDNQGYVCEWNSRLRFPPLRIDGRPDGDGPTDSDWLDLGPDEDGGSGHIEVPVEEI